MKLSNGRKIIKSQFTPLPMTDDVIQRVLDIGSKQKGPYGLIFKNKDGSIAAEVDDSSTCSTGVDNTQNTGVLENEFTIEETYQEITENDYDKDVYEEYEEEDERVINYETNVQVPPRNIPDLSNNIPLHNNDEQNDNNHNGDITMNKYI